MNGDSVYCTRVSIESVVRPFKTSFTRLSFCWRFLNSTPMIVLPPLAEAGIVPLS